MEAPFDRGEVDRASLDATERLRARLSGRPIAPAPRRSRSILPWAFAGALFVFSAGMIATPWFESTVRGKLPFVGVAAPQPADTAEIKALRDRLAQLESRAGNAGAPMPSERLARAEGQVETNTDQIARESDRIDRLTSDVAAMGAAQAADRAREDSAVATAIVAADRAQGMLTLVLARRAIETGRPFGTLDAALRRSFEARYPDAVKSVAALGSAPVTLATLRRDFAALGPAIGAPPTATARQSWWDTLTTKISQAVSTPLGNAPQSPSETANAALLRGDYLAAANHLRRLPLPRSAALVNWLAAVDRLQAGSQALATLETAMALAPPAIVAAPSAPAPVAPPSAPAASPAQTQTVPAGNRISLAPGHADSISATVHRALDLRGLFQRSMASLSIG